MILVGHSYGGVVITEAGNDPKVVGLVYIAAFAPDKGESVPTLIKDPATRRAGAADPAASGWLPVSRPGEVRRVVRRRRRLPRRREFMADSQVPWGVDALNGTISEPAWRSKPSWYLVATDDKMIPPPAQQAMSKRAGSTVVEVKGSHAVYVSQPKAVAAFIAKAALESTSAGTRARVAKQ